MTTTTDISQRILEENNFVTDASSVNVTAQQIMTQNNYSVSDLALATLEPMINNVINYVNLEANTTISLMSGTAESKIVTLTRSEASTVKTLSALVIRAYLDRGPNVAIQGQSIGQIITDPQYSLLSELVTAGIARLRTCNPIYVEQLITNAINLINLHAGTSITALTGTVGNKSLTATDKETVVIKIIASAMLQHSLARTLGEFELTETMLLSIDKLRSVGSIAFVVGDDTSGLG